MKKYKIEKLDKLRLKLIKKINGKNNEKEKEVENFLRILKTKIGKIVLDINALELQILDF